jgi:hypothetical protein
VLRAQVQVREPGLAQESVQEPAPARGLAQVRASEPVQGLVPARVPALLQEPVRAQRLPCRRNPRSRYPK